jgi:hypothetical protein
MGEEGERKRKRKMGVGGGGKRPRRGVNELNLMRGGSGGGWVWS